MRGLTLYTTTLALAVPAILWPPRPVRAADLEQPVAPLVVTQSPNVSSSR